MPVPDIAVGAIAASIVAAVFSVVSLIASKEAKISEFRQSWIDSLRNEVSKFIASANGIHGCNVTLKDSETIWGSAKSYLENINISTSQIRLRLNSSEKESADVLKIIDEFEEIFAPGNHLDHNVINRAEKRLVLATNLVLKQEWRRVKRGEPVFVILKYSIIVIGLAALAALGWLLWGVRLGS